jgi:ATP-dependent Clp protease ATP-binding subunit ClpC
VGYEEGGRLTEAVRRKPYSVILFDEMEKAHPDVFNILLQILEDGQLTDASGRKVNFRNTIIIMTSNIGLRDLNQQAVKIGFEDAEVVEAEENKSKAKAKTASNKKKESEKEYEQIKERIIGSLREQYRPEFLNRIDKIVVFKPLGKEEIEKIAELQLQELASHLKTQSINLQVNPAAIKFISNKSFDPAQGARLVRRNIQDLIEDPLAEKLITDKFKEGSTIKMKVQDNQIVLV